MAIRVALIGYGAIAAEVCRSLDADDQISVAQVLVRRERQVEVQRLMPDGINAIDSIAALSPGTDLVLECASHRAVWCHAPAVLEQGIDFGVISAGALADAAQFDRLQAASLAGRARLIVLPGAIGGIDALAAARAGVHSVSYVARKPPLSWAGSPAETQHDLSRITTPTVLFQGSARIAAQTYPKNANVVATVALAGIGFEATEVCLMADPGAVGNSHQITARGPGIELNYTTASAALPDNPRTSALTAQSALRALRHRGYGIVI